MFTHQTVLSLRLPSSATAMSPVFGHFRDYHFARNVMEVKQHLLRCLRRMNFAHLKMPDEIHVEAGHDSADIKSELERWMSEHWELRDIRVRMPSKPGWWQRQWKRWMAGCQAAPS